MRSLEFSEDVPLEARLYRNASILQRKENTICPSMQKISDSPFCILRSSDIVGFDVPVFRGTIPFCCLKIRYAQACKRYWILLFAFSDHPILLVSKCRYSTVQYHFVV
jgi:hypothetical protein